MDVGLVMFRPDGSKRVFALTPGASSIGRKDDCTIRVPLAAVSRHHAQIHVDEDGASIKDLGSANGTYLNNQKITEEDLEPGDQIMIGPVIFTVQLNGEPGDDELIEIRSKLSSPSAATGPSSLSTSQHMATADDDDPIAALEALASSADQTAITPELDEE